MKKILTDAVAVGNAIARANLFASRDPQTRIYDNRQWFTPFVGGSYQFLNGAGTAARCADDVLHYATGITPASDRIAPRHRIGLRYHRSRRAGQVPRRQPHLQGYPARTDSGENWSFTAYDNQTRSPLPTGQKLAGLDSTLPGIAMNLTGCHRLVQPRGADGSRKNWVQTWPGRATTPPCDSTVRWSPGSTSRGDRVTSNCSDSCRAHAKPGLQVP